MIVDGRGGAVVRHRESRQDHRPGEYVSRVKYVQRGFGDPKTDDGKNSYGGKNNYGGLNNYGSKNS
jgi:hypothetical protein